MKRRPRLPLWRKIIYALLPVVVLVVGAELLLRLIGYTSPAADPLESFVYHRPLFADEDRDGRLTTNPRRRRFFHDQSFTAEKQDGTIRVFVVGGSMTYGYKLADPLAEAYPARLAARLSERLGKPVEIINGGGLQYASYRLGGLFEECLAYAPDLMIVMSGNNEFLEPRHYQELMKKPSTFERWWYELRIVHLILEWSTRYRSVMDADTIDERYIVRNIQEVAYTRDHFVRNINRFVEKSKQARVPLILCTVPTNVRDHPPFLMEPPADVPRDEVDRRYHEMRILYEVGKYEEALDVARPMLDRVPRAASFHYVAAKCLDHLERFDEAAEHYQLAKDTDAFPHRMLTSFNDSIRKIADQQGVALYDGEQVFAGRALNGIPGNDLFIDQCHPDAGGHRLLADGLSVIAAEILATEN